MKQINLPLPEIPVLAGTRAMLGAGLALLFADKLPHDARKKIAWALFLVGALTTIPLARDIFRRAQAGRPSAIQGD